MAWTDDPADPTTHRRDADRAACRAAAGSHPSQVEVDPADLGHHRHAQRGSACGRGWRRRRGGDLGAAAMARRGNHRRGSAAVSCVGVRATDHRNDDVVHAGGATHIRCCGHDGTRRPLPRHRFERGAGDAGPDHGTARRGSEPLQRAIAAVRQCRRLADATRRRDQVHGPVRRRRLQQLQRHRGRRDRPCRARGPARGPRHRRKADAGHGDSHPGRRIAARSRAVEIGQIFARTTTAVRGLHDRTDQGCPGRLHGLR